MSQVLAVAAVSNWGVLSCALLLIGLGALGSWFFRFYSRPPIEETEEEAAYRVAYEKSVVIQKRLSELFSKIDFRVSRDDYEGLSFTDADNHAAAIVDAVDRIYGACHDAGETRGAFVPWLDQEKQKMKEVFSGLLVWGSRRFINECIYERLKTRGVDNLFLEDAYDLDRATGIAPDFTKITAQDYYNV